MRLRYKLIGLTYKTTRYKIIRLKCISDATWSALFL